MNLLSHAIRVALVTQQRRFAEEEYTRAQTALTTALAERKVQDAMSVGVSVG